MAVVTTRAVRAVAKGVPQNTSAEIVRSLADSATEAHIRNALERIARAQGSQNPWGRRLPNSPWKVGNVARVAARAGSLARGFNPLGLVVSELVRLGLDHLAHRMMQDLAQAWDQRGVFAPTPLHMPVAGGLNVGGGWEEITSEFPLYDAYGASAQWYEGFSIPSYLDAWGYLLPLALPITAPYARYEVSSTGLVPDAAWPDPKPLGTTRIFRSLEAGAEISFSPQAMIAVAADAFAMPQAKTKGIGWARAAQRQSNDWPLGYRAGYALPTVAVDTITVGAAEPAAATRGALDALPGGALAQSVARTVQQAHRARERKLKLPGWRRAMAVKFIEGAVEASDSLGAVYLALPPSIRRMVRQEWVEGEFNNGVLRPSREIPDSWKLYAIWKYWRFLDTHSVFRELLWEQMEDFAYAYQSKLAIGAQRGIGMTPNTTAPDPYFSDGNPLSPKNEHPLARGLPLDVLQEWVTGREVRGNRQEKDQRVRQLAIDEQTRRSRNRAAESDRRRRYREAQRAQRR